MMYHHQMPITNAFKKVKNPKLFSHTPCPMCKQTEWSKQGAYPHTGKKEWCRCDLIQYQNSDKAYSRKITDEPFRCSDLTLDPTIQTELHKCAHKNHFWPRPPSSSRPRPGDYAQYDPGCSCYDCFCRKYYAEVGGQLVPSLCRCNETQPTNVPIKWDPCNFDVAWPGVATTQTNPYPSCDANTGGPCACLGPSPKEKEKCCMV